MASTIGVLDSCNLTDDTPFSVLFAALYLPGGFRPCSVARRNWPQVEHILRARGFDVESLRRSGLSKEAYVLSDETTLAWARLQVAQKRCLTVFDAPYPSQWITKLGASAPPAVWISGQVPQSPFLSIVGGRQPSRKAYRFCFSAAQSAIALGYTVVSGGAVGCDRAAMSGALHLAKRHPYIPTRHLVLLPRGIQPSDCIPGICYLSTQSPGSEFSTPAAMERNALIYAVGEATLVASSRFKQGGTWLGATDALRRRLSTVYIREDSGDLAFGALMGLGACSISDGEVESPRSLQLALSSDKTNYQQARLAFDVVASSSFHLDYQLQSR